MFELSDLLAYILVVLALFVVPGPAVLLILAQSMSGGRKVGLATSLGIAVGDGVHTVAAALGLSALLMTSPTAFNLVKYAGIAYLVYVGVRAWAVPAESMPKVRGQLLDPRRAFYRALWTEVLNPRTALFFLAFLPQFVRPAGGPVVMQLLVLGLIFVLLSAGYASGLALVAGSVGRWLVKHSGIARWQGRIIGCVYIALGLRLILQRPG